MRLTVKPGIARLVTVAHYGLAVVMVLFFVLMAIEGKARSWTAPLGGLFLYYWALESSVAGRWIGDQFVKRSLLTSAQLLWADLNVAALLGGAFFEIPVIYREPLGWVGIVLIQWVVGAASALLVWLTAEWVARGFVEK